MKETYRVSNQYISSREGEGSRGGFKILEKCARDTPIDPFNKSNIYSFPLLTSLKLKVFNRISKAEYVVNSGKLCILDLLKGSIGGALGVFPRKGLQLRSSETGFLTF